MRFVVWLLAAGCVRNECKTIDALPDGDVLAVGDSVLAWNHDTCQSVPDQVGALRGARVEVAAVNGARLSGGGSIPAQVVDGPWAWAIVDGGANDLNQLCECGECSVVLDDLADSTGATGAMPDLVDGLIAQGARVAIAGPYLPGKNAWYGFDRCEVALRHLRERYLAVAALRPEDVVYVDLLDVVDPIEQPELFWLDNVHPNPDGALVIAGAIADAMDGLQ